MELKQMLKVEALGFHFDTRAVFADYDLSLDAGITWLRGVNGAGKTTLLKLLGGALRPSAGRIVQGTLDSERDALAYRQQCFYCGSDTPELPWLTVQEWLDLHLALYPAADAAVLDVHLAAFGLLAARGQAVSTLSLGQHKKLQLALALTLPVRLLLIDEPFNGLDAAANAYLRQQLTQLETMKTVCVVLTSHLDPEVPLRRTLDLLAPA